MLRYRAGLFSLAFAIIVFMLTMGVTSIVRATPSCEDGSTLEGSRCVNYTKRNAEAFAKLESSVPDEIKEKAYQYFKNNCSGSGIPCPDLSYESFLQDNFSDTLYYCNDSAAAAVKQAQERSMLPGHTRFAQCLADKYYLSTEDKSLIAKKAADNNIDYISITGAIESASVTEPIATEESDDGESDTTCAVEGIGWITCPVINFIANINDAAFDQIKNFLTIRPTLLDTNSGTFKAWGYFRNIANALFVVMFLWVIFSQITSIGISNYGIKKIMPRLIISALLINVSFFICQLAVDLSNIIGYSLAEMLSGAAGSITSPGSASSGGASFVEVFTIILATAGAVIFAYLVVGVPVLLAGALAIAMVFIILIGRQAAVILLVALSPLAFAAWLLPNIEGLFKKWVDVFKALLMVFPIVAALYGAGSLASAVLRAAATSDPNNTDMALQLASLGVMAIPLAATPSMLRNSLNSLGAVGAKLSGLSSSANQKLKGTAMEKSRLPELRNKMKTNSLRRQAERRSGNGLMARFGRRIQSSDNKLVRGLGKAMSAPSDLRRRLDNSALGRAAGLDKGAGLAKAQLNALFEEDVKNAAQELSGLTTQQARDIVVSGRGINGGKASDAMIAAAMDKVGQTGGFSDRSKVMAAVASNSSMSNSLKDRFIRHSYAKGDAEAYGNGFGDMILSGNIKSEQDLMDSVVKNAADGNLKGDHMVDSSSKTKYILDAIRRSGRSDSTVAMNNARGAARAARASATLSSRIDANIDTEFKRIGV